MSTNARPHLAGLTCAEVGTLARAHLPGGSDLARELYRAYFRQGGFAPELSRVSQGAAAWHAALRADLPEVKRQLSERDSHGGTTAKAVLRLDDGLEVECVLIPMGRERHTLCMSSQVGCRMGCTFCETGRMGFLRNLAAWEIVAQVLVARQVLGWKVDRLVFMGMGEALDNPEGLFQALQVLTERNGLGFSHEDLTVCTVGHLEGITRLHALGWKRLNLSLSLTSAVPQTRERSMPITKRWSLNQVQAALAAYAQRRNFVLGVNLCHLPGVNDSPQEIAAIADFCRPLGRVLINVIPYNPGTQPVGRAPEECEIQAYISALRAAGLAVRRRITKGRSVMAACGQLGNTELRMLRTVSRGQNDRISP